MDPISNDEPQEVGADDMLFRDVCLDDGMQLRAIDDESRSIDFVVSTAAEDDHGTIIEQDWDLRRFKRNPAVLLNHNLPIGGLFGGGGGAKVTDTIPIARGEKTRVEDGKLLSRIVFPPVGEDERSDAVWKAIRSKRLNAVSVGFRPRVVAREELDDGRVRYRLSKCELFEISIVPVGSNAESVAQRSLKILERRVAAEAATHQAKVATVRPHQETRMATAEKTLSSEMTTGTIKELREPAPAVEVATLAAIVGCDANESSCIRTVTELAARAKTAEAETSGLKALAAIGKTARSSLNLADTATEADVSKSIVGLQARSGELDELKPKFEKQVSDLEARDAADAEREVAFLLKRGKEYGFTYGETAKRGLLAFRKSDPKGFAEDHKAALDGLRAFDDPKLFAPIAPAKTEKRAGLTPTPEMSSETTLGSTEVPNDALYRKADDLQKEAAAKGTPMSRSAALDAARDLL